MNSVFFLENVFKYQSFGALSVSSCVSDTISFVASDTVSFFHIEQYVCEIRNGLGDKQLEVFRDFGGNNHQLRPFTM